MTVAHNSLLLLIESIIIMEIIIFLITGIIIGALAGWLITKLSLKITSVSKRELDQAAEHISRLETEKAGLIASEAKYAADLGAARETLSDVRRDMETLKSEIQKRSEEFHEKNKEAEGLKAENRGLLQRLDTQKKEIEELGKRFNMEFENIASKILEEKSHKFTEKNRENIEHILKPLGDNIKAFRDKVEEVYDKESKERFSLGREVQNLIKLNQQVSQEAQNLTHALKGSSKVQGDWGQMILENILERSGLRKDSEYFIQEFLKDDAGNILKNEDGRRMQPDVIVSYPDNRKVIIDSKVSLTAYERYMSSDDPVEQQKALADHLNSITRHISDLSGKRYQDFAETLDFVMMFVPNENAYLLAMQHDSQLWNKAYEKGILLISPTNLIAALRLIADLWKREYQNQNAMAIAERGAALYDKFVGFVENLTDVGTHIDRTKKSYDTAFGQLKEGRGNLISQAEKLRELGVKTKKNLPSALSSGDE